MSSSECGVIHVLAINRGLAELDHRGLLHDLVSSSHASYYCRAELDESAPLHSLVGRPYAFFLAVLAAPQSEPGLTRSG